MLPCYLPSLLAVVSILGSGQCITEESSWAIFKNNGKVAEYDKSASFPFQSIRKSFISTLKATKEYKYLDYIAVADALTPQMYESALVGISAPTEAEDISEFLDTTIGPAITETEFSHLPSFLLNAISIGLGVADSISPELEAAFPGLLRDSYNDLNEASVSVLMNVFRHAHSSVSRLPYMDELVALEYTQFRPKLYPLSPITRDLNVECKKIFLEMLQPRSLYSKFTRKFIGSKVFTARFAQKLICTSPEVVADALEEKVMEGKSKAGSVTIGSPATHDGEAVKGKITTTRLLRPPSSQKSRSPPSASTLKMASNMGDIGRNHHFAKVKDVKAEDLIRSIMGKSSNYRDVVGKDKSPRKADIKSKSTKRKSKKVLEFYY